MIPLFGYSKIFNNPLDLHIAFMREVNEDVEFIRQLYFEINKKLPKKIAEIQCGPAYYASAFCKLGCDSIAVDSSLAIIDFAKSLKSNETFKILWKQQSPTHFSFSPVDVCLLPLDSFTYFLNDEEQSKFFKSAYDCLEDSGILIVELNHPKDIGYIDYSVVYPLSKTIYPNYSVKVEWGVNNPQYDLITGLTQTEINITRTSKGKNSTEIIQSTERTNFPKAVKIVAERQGLKAIHFFGGYNFSPLSWNSDLQVIVFQKNLDVK